MSKTIQRGKIKKTLCPSVIKNIVEPNIKGDMDHSYQTYLDLNKAHVVMIAKQGIIARDVAKEILKVTKEMADMGDQPTFPIDPKLEGVYFNLEKYLIDRTGIEIGGQQHTARSRNDMNATMSRMDARRFYLQLCRKFNLMRRAILETARRNTDAVMAGYTHLQPSEPITFAHYCSGILAGLDRDYSRLSHVFQNMNICPMGGGSMGSTTWNIDRQLMSDLLGFDRPMDNSVDAVGSRDFALELLSALSILGNTLSRFCHDLYVWATPEYGYIEVDDSVAICSSIMPQKKNPYTLEYVKGKAGNVEGFYAGSYATLKNTPYTNVCDVCGESTRYIFTAMSEMQGCFELMVDTISTLKTNKQRMLDNARGNFCTVTELANSLVRHDHISFRAAHEIVALVVDHMITTGKRSNEITKADVDRFFMQLFNKQTGLSDEDIQQALDPKKNAESKNILGGTSEAEVNRQLDTRLHQIESDEAQLAQWVAQVDGAKARLEKEVIDLIE